jgi:ZIP family zinc transporter
MDHRSSVQYLPFIVIGCALLANYAGGVFARHVTDRMHLALGFSAGTVLAASFFIFLPQAILSGGAAHSSDELLPLVGLGFVIGLLLDRFGFFWIAEKEGHRTMREHHAHGVLNGAAIGIAYHVSPAVGGLVAAALLAHEFSDSVAVMNTLRDRQAGGGLRASSIGSLCYAAGLAATSFYSVTPALLGAALALFGGYFIYLSASDLIPESHHSHPQLLTVGMTFGGAGALYFANYVLAR